MKRTILSTLVAGPALLLAALLIPATASAAGPITSTACSGSGSGTVSCEITAKAGTLSLPGLPAPGTVPIWGYAAGDHLVAGDPTVPGPVLVATVGDAVTVTLDNDLTETTGIVFEGLSMAVGLDPVPPDLIGAAPGGTTSYTFDASTPGTYLYEAGLISGTQHQVAMGLYGMLIIRPSTAGQAYSDPSTAYVDEAAVVLSEIDPALNRLGDPSGTGDPSTFDLRAYAPQYFLVNGKAYPETDPIDTAAGSKVLLRYANAGLRHHSVATLGLSQTVIADDGSPAAHSHRMVAETIAPGQTMDAIATVPAGAAMGTRYALYDANQWFANSNGAAFGGMLAFLTVSGTPPSPGGGPATTSVELSPSVTNGSAAVGITATADATATAAEFFVDATGPAGTGTSMTGGSGTFTGSLGTGLLATLSSGSHTVYVHSQDATLAWGSFNFAVLNLDKTGPATTGAALSPSVTSGTPVAISGTATDVATGGSNIAGAEYWIDATGTPSPGTGTSLTVNAAAPVAAISGTIGTATINGLSEGTRVVSIQSRDALGNRGAIATVNLVVDRTGPTTSSVVATPGTTNGEVGFNSTTPAVRISASFSDTLTNISTAEGFIDTVGTNGTGFTFTATDGLFNSPTEGGFADIPLTTVRLLSNGAHKIYVHAKDAAGNWETTASFGLLVVDRPPLYFSTSGSANPPGVGGSADDADIYFYNGSAFSRVFDASADGLPNSANVDGFDRIDGSHFYLSFASDTTIAGFGTVQDEDVVYYDQGDWSVYFDGTAAGLTANNQDLDAISIVGGILYFSTAGATNPPGVTGTADDADIYSWNGSTFARVFDATALGWSSVNVDGFVRVDATHFYLSYASDTTVPVLGAVQDEDVVYYDTGTWSMYFDGTSRGLTSNNLDIDAFDIP